MVIMKNALWKDILRDINNSFAVPKPKTAELFKDAHADIKAYKCLY